MAFQSPSSRAVSAPSPTHAEMPAVRASLVIYSLREECLSYRHGIRGSIPTELLERPVVTRLASGEYTQRFSHDALLAPTQVKLIRALSSDSNQ